MTWKRPIETECSLLEGFNQSGYLFRRMLQIVVQDDHASTPTAVEPLHDRAVLPAVAFQLQRAGSSVFFAKRRGNCRTIVRTRIIDQEHFVVLRNTDEYLPDSMDQFADCLPAVVDGDDDRVVDAVRPHGFSLAACRTFEVTPNGHH